MVWTIAVHRDPPLLMVVLAQLKQPWPSPDHVRTLVFALYSPDSPPSAAPPLTWSCSTAWHRLM